MKKDAIAFFENGWFLGCYWKTNGEYNGIRNDGKFYSRTHDEKWAATEDEILKWLEADEVHE